MESVAFVESGGALAERFVAIAPEVSGLDFQNTVDVSKALRGDYRPLLNGSMGGGVAVGDVDGDGWLDVYVTSREAANRLYRQTAPFRFEDITAAMEGGDSDGVDIGAAMADVDHDGDLDVFVTRYGAANQLWINDGTGHFRDEAMGRGVGYVGSSVTAAFQDYDLDGDLDIYLVTNRRFIPQERLQQIMASEQARLARDGAGSEVPEALREWIYYFSYEDAKTGKTVSQALKAGQRDILYRNRGDGTFEDVTASAGLLSYFRGHSATWTDYDADGRPDLYVANDYFDPDLLYHNRGDGTFEEVSASVLPYTPWFSMGSDVADLNNDGWWDLFASDMSATTHFKQKVNMGMMSDTAWFLTAAQPTQMMRNMLFVNTGRDRFQEVAPYAGLKSTDWTWSVLLEDLDSDGWVDALFTNGFIRNIMDSDLKARIQGQIRDQAAFGEALLSQPPLVERDLVYRNRGALSFESVGADWGLDHEGVSAGAALADFDRDGDLDVLVNRLNEPLGLYENQVTQGHRLIVQLQGESSESQGVGATIRVVAQGRTFSRRLSVSRGYASSQAAEAHFGLGSVSTIDRVEILWPSGRHQIIEGVAIDQRLKVVEPTDTAIALREEPEDAPWFREVSAALGLRFRHVAIGFDDFQWQPLVPYRLSQVGSGLAVGDANGDGWDDVYVAGGARQPGALFVNEAGAFQRRSGPWEARPLSHETTPIWLDYDSDGDLDLFVASGGAHEPEGAAVYRNALYENRGAEGFVDASERLPATAWSVGPAAAADFDRDGDLDLFLGSRCVPGKYPVTPQSQLLRNDEGTFVDATDAVAAPVRLAGLVTAALWSDVNDDGWLDLLVAVEWGPVRVFANQSGRLFEVTKALELSARSNWWQSLAGGDLDGDGTIDYWAGATGTNTKYHADPAHPALLYFGDYEGAGAYNIVEAKFEGDALLPVRGLSCSSSAMPSLATKFPTFRSFAQSALPEIYGPESLDRSARLAATSLETAIWFNQGIAKGMVAETAAPEAQWAPVFGSQIVDVNRDGRQDLIAVQNFYGPEPETGPMAGGLGFLALGDGSGGLDTVHPATSGWVVSGDARGLVALDFDRDGDDDFLVSRNGQAVQAWRNDVSEVPVLRIRLRGRPGNPAAIGARLRLLTPEAPAQEREIAAGSGFWSQSTAEVVFSGVADQDRALLVRWPDGAVSRHSVAAGIERAQIAQPDVFGAPISQ